jgi:hypothetical protein
VDTVRRRSEWCRGDFIGVLGRDMEAVDAMSGAVPVDVTDRLDGIRRNRSVDLEHDREGDEGVIAAGVVAFVFAAAAAAARRCARFAVANDTLDAARRTLHNGEEGVDGICDVGLVRGGVEGVAISGVEHRVDESGVVGRLILDDDAFDLHFC